MIFRIDDNLFTDFSVSVVLLVEECVQKRDNFESNKVLDDIKHSVIKDDNSVTNNGD